MGRRRMKARHLPDYVTVFRDRHGRERFRFRKKGAPSCYLPAPTDPAFPAAYDAALKARPASGEEKTAVGTVADLVARYYAGADFKALRASTQRFYRNVMERFRAEHGHRRWETLQRSHIVRLRDAWAARPGAANNLLKILRILGAYAVDLGWRDDNPAATVRKVRYQSEGFHTWTEEEIERFEAHWPSGTPQRLALALLVYTAQRRSDVVTMGWQHVRAGEISVRQLKTRKRLLIPIATDLAAELAHASTDRLTFLETGYGKPRSAAGFGNWFREACDAAGLPQCSAHGLRKAASRRLAEVGCTSHQIMAITGHESLSEVERYTKAAEQKALATAAVVRLETRKGTPNV